MDQFLEWIIIALVGGAICGALAFWFYRKVVQKERHAQRNRIDPSATGN